MLKASKPTQLAEGVTMSPARMMLEILAIYETFGGSQFSKITLLMIADTAGCLTLGEEPTLISDKGDSWW